MENFPDQKSIQEALKLANSPAGQKLIQMLQTSNPDVVSTAQKQAEQGNYDQVRATVMQLMQSSQVQKMIQEMRNGHG